MPRDPRAYFLRATFYAHPVAQDWEKSAEALARGLDLIPAEPPWKPAEDWFVGHASSFPEEVYARLAKKRAIPAWVNVRRAWHLGSQNPPRAADALIQEALRQRPKDRALRVEASLLHGAWGKWEQAFAELEAARKLGDFGDDSLLWFDAAAYLAAAGKSDEHRALCARMAKQFEGSRDALVAGRLALARLLVAGRPMPAELAERAESDLRADPRHGLRVLVAALTRLRAGRAGAAAPLIEEYLKSNAPSPSYLAMFRLVRGMALAGQKQAEAARSELRQGLGPLAYGNFPNSAAPFRAPAMDWAAAEALARQARPVYAALMRDVATLRPSDAPELLRRARHHAGFGRWRQAGDEAAALCRVADFGNDLFAWHEAASYLAAGGRRADYRAHCAKMFERFKAFPPAGVHEYVALSCLLVPGGVGEPKRLLEMAEGARKIHPMLPWCTFSAALARSAAGQDEVAVTLVRDYLKRGMHRRFGKQDEIVLRLVLGLALARLHKDAEARVEFTEAVKAFEERFPPGKEPAHLQEPPHGWATARAVYLMAQPVLDRLAPGPKK